MEDPLDTARELYDVLVAVSNQALGQLSDDLKAQINEACNRYEDNVVVRDWYGLT